MHLAGFNTSHKKNTFFSLKIWPHSSPFLPQRQHYITNMLIIKKRVACSMQYTLNDLPDSTPTF